MSIRQYRTINLSVTGTNNGIKRKHLIEQSRLWPEQDIGVNRQEMDFNQTKMRKTVTRKILGEKLNKTTTTTTEETTLKKNILPDRKEAIHNLVDMLSLEDDEKKFQVRNNESIAARNLDLYALPRWYPKKEGNE